MAKKLLNISLSSVCPESLALAAGCSDRINLMRVYGETNQLLPARNGQMTITGDFRAINLETKEEFASSVLYLPRGLQEAVLVATDNGDNIVRFAYDIWADPEPKRKSYTIGFSDLIEDTSAPDPLAGFAKGLPKLPE